MTTGTDQIKSALEAALSGVYPGTSTVTDLRQLSGGASQETWAFNLSTGEGLKELILRRAPGGVVAKRATAAPDHATEAAILKLAHKAGVSVPEVPCVLSDAHGIGPGYVMTRIEGETIARKILRDAEFANARKVLAFQCGEALARIHRIPRETLPPLNAVTPREQLAQYRETYDSYDYPHPVFEAAFKWLEQRLPEADELTLVHGDFRNGNLIVGPEGIRAVLDWELTHVGDPAEDLGWLCVNSWRFGETTKVAGGFGSVEHLLEGYRAGGGTGMTAERVRFWEIFGTLKWGIMCMTMYQAFAQGTDRSVERAAIGRRSSETEIDLVNILYDRPSPP
ncbi:MAG: phosphotransferase family protein [Alphaproteobacteria bacterium]|nr:phosphotransferase family protein [Alphaproteobacteria bacterium]